jgi:hypothetical protein
MVNLLVTRRKVEIARKRKRAALFLMTFYFKN